MNAWVLAGYLDEKSLEQVVQALAETGVMFILESSEDLCLGRLAAPPDEDAAQPGLEAIAPVTQEEGRLFASDFELRWQRLRAYPPYRYPFRARLIVEDQSQLDQAFPAAWRNREGAVAKPCQLCYVRRDTLYLWGEAVAGSSAPRSWYEKEVPRLFHYPVADLNAGRRIKMEMIVYQLSTPLSAETGGDTDPSWDKPLPADEPLYLERFVKFLTAE